MFERAQIADVAQVYELWNEYAAACQAGDLDRWMALWCEDGIQMAPGGPPRASKSQIRAAVHPSFADFIMSNMVINTEEVRILGDRGYSHGTYVFEKTSLKGGESISITGHFLSILAKQSDGSWKLVIDCRNYQEPPKPPRRRSK